MAFAWYTGGAETLSVGGTETPSPKTVLGPKLWARWAKGFAAKPSPAPTGYEILGSAMLALWDSYNSGTRTLTKNANSHASTTNMTAPDAGSAPGDTTTGGGYAAMNFNVGAAGDEDGLTGGNIGGLPGSVTGSYLWSCVMNATARGAIQQVHRIIDGSAPNTLAIDAANKFGDSSGSFYSNSAITGSAKSVIVIGDGTSTQMWVDGTLQTLTGAGGAFGGTSATWGGGTHEFGCHNAGTGFEAYPLDADVSHIMVAWRAGNGAFSSGDIAAIVAWHNDIINGVGNASAWTDEEQALQLTQSGATLQPALDVTSQSYPAVTFDADASEVDSLSTSAGQAFPGGTTSIMFWGCFSVENGATDTATLKTLLDSGPAALLTIELVNAAVTVTDEGTADTLTSAALGVGDHYYVLILKADDSAKLYVDGALVDSTAGFDTSVIIAGLDSIKVGT